MQELIAFASASGDLSKQVQKDAMMQIVKMRMSNEDSIDIAGLLKVLDAELNQQSNLIVVRRTVQLLKTLSDFNQLKEQPQLQDSLIRRLLVIFNADSGDSADLCLKMSCVDYMINFFNDYEFQTETYASVVPDVVYQSAVMMRRLMASGKPSIVTEVMQLYRFIVDKYSTLECKMSDGTTVMETLC